MKLCHRIKQPAFTRLDLLILAALAVVAVVLLPLLARPNRRPPPAARITCSVQLKQIGLAYRQWAVDNNDKFPMQVSVTNGGAMERAEGGDICLNYLVMSNELNTPKLMFCPADERRIIATTFAQSLPPNSSSSAAPFTSNSISYVVDLDADETNPNAIVSGDDNFLVGGVKPKPGALLLWTNSPVAWTKDRHVNQGNIGLADGSVRGVNTPQFREALITTGLETNRLLMP
jgi:prepilin-type processing-associated H-X9-DG protein